VKSQTKSICITLTDAEGKELRNQILKLCNGSMAMHAGEHKGTPLAELFELLSGNFEQSTKGVNFL
jgi:hypothetical protein